MRERSKLRPWMIGATTLLVLAGIALATTPLPPAYRITALDFISTTSSFVPSGRQGFWNNSGTLKYRNTDGTDSLPAIIPATTKGDLAVYNGSSWSKLGVGSNSQVLTADSTQASGVKWAVGGGGSGTLPTDYTNGSAGPQVIALDSTRLGIAIKDAASTVGDLFVVENNGATTPMLRLNGNDATGVVIQNMGTQGFYKINSGIGTQWGWSSVSGTIDSVNITWVGNGSTSKAVFNGIGQKWSRSTTATNYSALIQDTEIGVTDTTVARTVTMPSPASAGSGWTVFVCDDSGGAATHNIACAPNSTEKVNGAAATLTACVTANYSCAMCRTNATDWFCKVGN